MNRRDLIKAAPVALVGCALPLQAETETPVYRAFCDWKRLKADWDADLKRPDYTDEDGSRWCDVVYKAADAVLDAPSSGPMDFIYKLFAQSFDGEHDINDCPRGAELWAEARALVSG